jgi:hypothetical protein
MSKLLDLEVTCLYKVTFDSLCRLGSAPLSTVKADAPFRFGLVWHLET